MTVPTMAVPPMPPLTAGQAGVNGSAPSQDIPKIAAQILAATVTERERLKRIAAYMRGNHDGVYVPRGAKSEYHWLMRRSVVNFLPLIVSVVAQNLHVDGYRTSPVAEVSDDYTVAAQALGAAQQAITSGDIPAAHAIIAQAAVNPAAAKPAAPDNRPWEIWQANRMQSRQHGLHRAIAKYGVAYMLVMPGERGQHPLVRAVSPKRLTALYADDVNDEWPVYAVEQYSVAGPHGRKRIVQLYDENYRYTLTGPESTNTLEWMDSQDPLMPDGTTAIDYHGLGECPVIRFAHEIDLDGELDVSGEVEPMIELQDQVNTITFNLLMAMQYAAFRQRWVSGMVPDDQDGRPKEPFRSGVDRLWVAEDPTTKFGEFGQTSLKDFDEAREAAIRHMATISQVPPYHLLGQMVNLSAEALFAARDGLDRKITELQGTLDAPYQQTFQFFSHAAGDEKNADDNAGAVIWRDTGGRAFAATVDALGKMSQMLGVPATELWEKIPGINADDVGRWRAAVESPGVLEQLSKMLAVQESKGAMAATPSGGAVTPEEPFATDVHKPLGF
jgi:hypothetical protein